MTKVFLTVSLVLMVAFTVSANGPVAPFPEDVSTGYTNPLLHPWNTDVVAWVNGPPLTQYQYRSANGTIGDYFYVFGEQNNPYANAYQISTGSWVPSTSPPLGNCNWCGVPTPDALYIVGRYSGSYGNEIQKFVPSGGGPTGTWSQVANYPMAMCGIAAAWDGGDYIYSCGGGGSAGAVANAYKYSISGDTWTAIASMNSARKYHGAWFADGKFVAYGGYLTSATYDVYDPGTDTWTAGTATGLTDVFFSTFSTTGNSSYLFSVGGGAGYGSWPATDAVQIYDPDTDTWTQETPLPTAHGLNAAGVTNAGEVVSAGGYPTTYDCFEGSGFPTAGPPPTHDVVIDLTPVNPPIQIPAGGGTFNFDVDIANNETGVVNTDIWTMVELPDGSMYGPIINVNANLAGMATISRTRTQNVPSGAPSGDYTYYAYVGDYPGNIWDQASFPFTKLTDGDDNGVIGWYNGGESFEEFAGTPYAPLPEDVGGPATDPILHPWSMDVVSWATGPSLTQYQYRSANGTIGDYFYVFGEQNNPYANAYQISTGSWVPSTSPPLGNCNWCGVPTPSAFYIVGRYSGSYGNEIQKFVPSGGGPTGTWSQVAPYPMAMCGIAAAWDGGDLIYAAGGGGSSGAVANAYKYSISGNTWTAIASMPGPKKYHGGWFADGKFVVYGDITLPTAVYVYDPGSNTWSTGASLPSTVHFATFSTTGNSSYLFSVGGGGGYGSWPANDAVQIYDPDTDTWTMETPLPTAHGLNAAGVTIPGDVVSAGGYPTTYNVYEGSGFPMAGPPPVHDVEIALTPLGTPIQVPANGGSFDFDVDINNNETGVVNTDIWTMAELPSGTMYGPIINVNANLAGLAAINRTRTQNVPGGAPSGDYVYYGYVGQYPNNIWDEDSFIFEKLAVSDGGVIIPDWANTGEDWGEMTGETVSMTVETYALHNAYPNPFNPTTTIAYDLVEDAMVKLVVFDITGREIATLVDGLMPAGSHNSVFNAQNLSSGVYFYHLTADNYSATKKMILMK